MSLQKFSRENLEVKGLIGRGKSFKNAGEFMKMLHETQKRDVTRLNDRITAFEKDLEEKSIEITEMKHSSYELFDISKSDLKRIEDRINANTDKTVSNNAEYKDMISKLEA